MTYDPTKPAGPNATTQSVRDNFAALDNRLNNKVDVGDAHRDEQYYNTAPNHSVTLRAIINSSREITFTAIADCKPGNQFDKGVSYSIAVPNPIPSIFGAMTNERTFFYDLPVTFMTADNEEMALGSTGTIHIERTSFNFSFVRLQGDNSKRFSRARLRTTFVLQQASAY